MENIYKTKKKNLNKILGDSKKLKSFEVKKWFRQRANANSKSPQDEVGIA